MSCRYGELLSGLIGPLHGQWTEFNAGFLTGVGVVAAAVVVLLLLRLMLWLFRRRRRCRGIDIQEENGPVLIAADAIRDLVLSLQPEFPDLTMTRVRLYCRGRYQQLELQVTFDVGVRNMPEQRQRLKVRILEVLEQVLGITSVREVGIYCRALRVSDRLPEHGGPDAAEDIGVTVSPPETPSFRDGDE
ncbi:MAG: hypothetical protein PHQ27_02395 [Victivallales bacterium]|nr:hypothetical protein [Victivallales bacterium]